MVQIDERVRHVEMLMDTHIAVCDERAEKYSLTAENTFKELKEVRDMMKKYMERMLLAIIVIALANVFGADRVWMWATHSTR